MYLIEKNLHGGIHIFTLGIDVSNKKEFADWYVTYSVTLVILKEGEDIRRRCLGTVCYVMILSGPSGYIKLFRPITWLFKFKH